MIHKIDYIFDALDFINRTELCKNTSADNELIVEILRITNFLKDHFVRRTSHIHRNSNVRK